MNAESIKVDDFEYVPSTWPANFEHRGLADAGEFVNEHIARIESLKIKLVELPALSDKERDVLFHELDILRSAFIDLTSHQYRTPMGEESGKRSESKESSYLQKDDLILEGIIGASPAITHILKVIAGVAPSNLTVLLEGETGTGKELFARIIHLNSRRSKFVAVNCGAFPPELIESELFGHVKGAFTGATSDRKGKFEEATDGTIFLDEIGDLEPFAQVKLLRVLEVGEIQRVGTDQPRSVNVRVIAATNRNLDEMVRQGTFREDLFYRINMSPLYLPPLRERRDEIAILLEYFLEEACAKQGKPIPKIDSELRHFLYNIYDFRGNIRELKNIAQFMACIAGAERPVARVDLPLRVAGAPRPAAPDEQSVLGSGESKAPPELIQQGDAALPAAGQVGVGNRTRILHKAEEDYWVHILKKHRGNIQRICTETKLSRSRIYQILEKCKLKAKSFQ